MILSLGTLSFIILVVLVLVLVADRNNIVALVSARISVELASWGLDRLTEKGGTFYHHPLSIKIIENL